MASGGHSIQQQKSSLETRIKTLINNDLKEICKAYDYQVSGTKAVLQKRCLEILEDIVHQGDEVGFKELAYRVANHGAAPPRGQIASSGAPNNNGMNGYQQSYGMAGGFPRPQVHGARPFKSSPFYDIRATVLPRQELPAGAEMPQNRHTVRAVIALSPENIRLLKDDSSMRLLLYCGLNMMPMGPGAVEVSFPNQLEVRINGDDVKANYKGLKGKPGTTKPADITECVRKNPNYQNQLAVTYALTKNKFAFEVYLVKRITADTLSQRIRNGQVGGNITKQKVIDEMNQANSDDDIAATSVRMSLKDPISTLRITLPVRSIACKHNQCFDGSMFLQLQDQAPQWTCPVCNKPVKYDDLCIDKYFEDILQKTSSSVEKVDIEPNGEWRIIKEEEDSQSHSAAKTGRAPYDDDFDDDDDLIDITDEQIRQPNGSVPPARPALAIPSPAFPMNTPPLSSRDVSRAPSMASTQVGSKRPATAVIDLTFSDDEDEPPRSAKRQTTSTHPGPSAQSYSTSSSFPDPRYASLQAGQTHVADSSRPSGNAVRPASNGRTSAADYNNANHSFDQYAGRAGSPLRISASASPGYGGQPPQSASNWSAHLPRPPVPTHSTPQPQSHLGSPFAIRPPSAGPPQFSQYGHYQMQLPPMQAQPPQQNSYGSGWRDFSNPNGYSSATPPG